MTATRQQIIATPEAAHVPHVHHARPRGGGVTRLLGVVLGLALAGGAVWVQSIALDSTAMGAPLTYVGRVGGEVDGGRFSMKVTSVETAALIETPERPVETDQLFLIIGASGTVPAEPLKLPPPTLLTADGLKFRATDRIPATTTLANRWLQPGFWNDGLFIFEIPPSALPGARVIFEIPTSALYGDPVMPEIEIDLGLTKSAVDQLTSTPQDVYSLKKS